jgi:DNA-binding phage protein
MVLRDSDKERILSNDKEIHEFLKDCLREGRIDYAKRDILQLFFAMRTAQALERLDTTIIRST